MSHRVKVVLGPAKPGNDQSAYLFSLFLTNDFFLEVLLPMWRVVVGAEPKLGEKSRH